VAPESIHAQPVFLAIVGTEVSGFFWLKISRDTCYLAHLWLRSAYIGRGLGRVRFAEAVQQATAGGADWDGEIPAA